MKTTLYSINSYLRRGKGSAPYILLLAAFLSAWIVISARCFAKWPLFINDNIMGAAVCIGGFIVFTAVLSYVIAVLFYVLDTVNIWRSEECRPRFILFKWYINALMSKPFTVMFITMFVLYIPYMILSYPAIFSGDSADIIGQVYNFEGFYQTGSPVINFEYEGSTWYNHHPIVHTLLIHVFIELGVSLFSSFNMGVFMYSLVQTILVLAAVAMCLKTLLKLNVKSGIIVALMFYYVISPRISNYMFLLCKDMIFNVMVLVFFITLYKIFDHGKKIVYVINAFSIIGMILFRNDGFYILIITFAAAVILGKGFRKYMACCLAGIVVFFVLWSSVMLPLLKVSPGGKQEMLSIPIQHTARYVYEHPDEVTDEEKAIINKIMTYDLISGRYNPHLSDPVKYLFNKDATSEELMEYFKVWFEMFLKHPKTYVMATLNNKYRFFFPFDSYADFYDYAWSINCSYKVNEVCAEIGADFGHPEELHELRTQYETMREKVWKLPVLSMLLSPAMYIWAMLIWFIYTLYRRNTASMIMAVPFLAWLLILIAGPTNGEYFRYLYFYAMGLPIVILLGLCRMRNKNVVTE